MEYDWYVDEQQNERSSTRKMRNQESCMKQWQPRVWLSPLLLTVRERQREAARNFENPGNYLLEMLKVCDAFVS